MASTFKLKRKASSSSKSAVKRGKGVVVTPSTPKDESEEEVLDFGDADEDGEAGIMEDPMIDPQGSGSSDEEDDEEVRSEEEDEPKAGPSRPSGKKSLYSAPTVEELETLQETNSKGGTTFSLQLDALLNSTLLSTNPNPLLKDLLSTIHSKILSLPSLEGLSPAKALKKVGEIPFSGPKEYNLATLATEQVKWTLGYDKPVEIFVGGSWAVVGGYKKSKGEMGGIDLVVVMPPSLFSAKDRMDYRYFHKRSYYLAIISQQLQKIPGLKGVQITWSTANGDARRPLVLLTAGKDQGLKHRVEIRIHASVPSTVFPLSTLQSSKSLIRTGTETESSPTPLYSTSIIHDTLHKSRLLQLHRLSQALKDRTVDSFLALWRVWAARRGLGSHRGGTGWFAAVLLGWIVGGGDVGGVGGVREKTKKVRGVGKGLGHWGALRAAWEFIAHTDFEKTPVFISTDGDEDIVPHIEMTRAYQQVLVDFTGRVNVFAEWDQGDVLLLQHHARETLAMLEDESVDKFADVFLKSYIGQEVFDESIKVDISSAKLPQGISEISERSPSELAVNKFGEILRRGLSDRAKLVNISPSKPDTLQIGIIYNSETATRVIDIGPSSDAPEAETASFRKLWGDKAELRRFKDGTISESVVWDISRPEEATLIPGKIVKFLLGRHFGVSDEGVISLSNSSDWLEVVQLPSSARDAVCISGSEKQGFRPILSSYDELYRLLKDIDSDLPLGVLNVSPSSELLRYSSAFVSHPIDINRLVSAPECLSYVNKAEVVIQFESSPKWPDDLAAIQLVKLALFEKLASIIQGRIRRSQVNIVFEHDATDIEDSAALEVLLPSNSNGNIGGGAAFILRIHNERERSLLEKIATQDEPVFATSLPRPPRRLVLPALEKHILRFTHLPTHHSSIAPLHHLYPSYSSATRLLKRWFGSHMLSNYISVEVIELFMAKVYIDPGSLGVPSSASTGFTRAIQLLSEWEWKREPLFVPIFAVKDSSSSLRRIRFPREQRADALKTFESMRNKEKEVVHPWVVITEDDEQGLRWTRNVNALIAARVGVLAKATLAALKSENDIKSLFITPLASYDILLHLNPSILPRYAQSISADPSVWESKLQFRNLQTPSASSGVRIGYDPAENFVKDLQRIFGESMMWFFDLNGGNVIGGVWNPAKEKPRALKAFLGWATKPVPSDSALVVLDKDAIVAEVARLGKGLIERVERRR